MRMCDHPNVLSCYASFVHENELWLVMEFMSKGSCLHVMNVSKKEVGRSHRACTARMTFLKHFFRVPCISQGKSSNAYPIVDYRIYARRPARTTCPPKDIAFLFNSFYTAVSCPTTSCLPRGREGILLDLFFGRNMFCF